MIRSTTCALRVAYLACVAGTLLSAALPLQAQNPPQSAPAVVYAAADDVPEPVRLETFRIVWETVRDGYFDPTFGGIDWPAVRERYRPLVVAAPKSGAFHTLLQKMVSELPGSHLRVFAPGERTGGPAPPGPPPMAPDGVVVRVGEEGVLVYAVPEKSPSWEVGLRPGFLVLAVDGTELPDRAAIRNAPRIPLSRARQLLSGAEGSSAQVRVLDAAGKERVIALPRTVPFKRSANLAKPELEWRRTSPRVGYVRFDIWGPTLGAKLEPALAELGDTDALIIDIRNNSGGTEPGVNRLLKFLMAEPGLVAVTTKRGENPREWTHEGSGTGAYRGKVGILVDDLSGSASEVFAGVLQENGRAMVLGRTSYGGVLNSTTTQLPTGGTLQYAHSDMRTPKGRRIEGAGVVPEVAVELRRADLLAGKDTVIEKAIEALTALPTARPALTLTYVANSGVLVAAGDRKILIDALFDRPNPAYRAPSAETIDRMVGGIAPFDGVTAALVTHNHPDHFDPRVALRFLESRRDAVLVAPGDAVAAMKSAAADWPQVAPRVIAIDGPVGDRAMREVRGVSVTTFRTRHGSSDAPPNVMYLVDVNGWRLVHEGDSPGDVQEYTRLGLGTERVDLALVHQWFAFEPTLAAFLQQVLRPDHIALTHLPIDREAETPAKLDAVLKSYKDVFLLLPGMASKTFPGGPARATAR